ncbi:MAG: hypothetical protein HOE30_27270 [Deltaproteobacteria bacterium]|jgi:hypothetical protein|nr:hypothetical protein [Deltaproteobacteria bacterium]MBT4267609.1 hypothetical protein [Deltaproteobacteria bacterium]MBT4637581.1 hypothetical protein [Deltaproteobacteria bacterium]MBT6504558.1 hypothetical protein [Deltaproteobacteria bacterium]MBT6614554.1 hypothetical protein [Deltaproteobacteria bacterium]
MLVITVLDHDLDRMNACEEAVKRALKKVGIRANVTQVSEPPYLSRLNIWDRMPALEIEGKIWSKKGKEAYTVDEVVRLLTMLFLDEKS